LVHAPPRSSNRKHGLTLTYSSRRFDCNGMRNGATIGDLNSVEQMKSKLGFKAAHRDCSKLSADSVVIQNPKPVLSKAEGSRIQN
jgi:hypothetical protein